MGSFKELWRNQPNTVIGGGLFAFLSLGNKRTLKFSKPIPNIIELVY